MYEPGVLVRVVCAWQVVRQQLQTRLLALLEEQLRPHLLRIDLTVDDVRIAQGQVLVSVVSPPQNLRVLRKYAK